MKNIWNELIHSTGFFISALIVFLILPIGFINALGVASSDGGVLFIILLIIIGGIVYFRKNHSTETYKESAKAIYNGTASVQQKSKFLSSEIAEMEQKNKQLHILKLPLYYDLYSLYDVGKHRKPGVDAEDKITKYYNQALYLALADDPDIKPYYHLHLNIYDPAYVRAGRTAHIPQRIFEATVQNFLKEKKCNKQYAELHYSDELNRIRWKITYHCLNQIYYKATKVQLMEDLSGYSLVYPFDVPPLSWKFDNASEDAEEKFVHDAIDRLENCKAIARTLSSTERKNVYKELGLWAYQVYTFIQPLTREGKE